MIYTYVKQGVSVTGLKLAVSDLIGFSQIFDNQIFTIFDLYPFQMLKKSLFLIWAFGVAQMIQAQCDSVEYVMSGTLVTSSAVDIQIKLDEGTKIPEIGATGEISKFFETKLFGFLSTGWLNIGLIKITKVQNGVAYARVLEKHSEMTINGEKKNNFEAGKIVEFVWKEVPRREPYYQIKNGDTLAIGEYYCEQKTGKWTFFYPSGKLQEINYYENGLLEGEYKVWNENGGVIETGSFTKGQRNGELSFFYEDGTLKKREHYSEGKLHGLTEKWYPNGKKEFETNYKNGTLNGTFKDYFVDGKLKVEGTYLDGEYDGDLKVYYENGSLKYQTNFIEGKKNGKYFGYYESGKTHIETEFTAGEINGPYKEYYESGQLHFDCTFVYGKKNGLWKEYYENGQLAVTGIYNSDGLKTGLWVEYFENGQLEVTGQYDDKEKKTGVWETFYDDGEPASKGSYSNDVKTGKWMNWDKDGKKTKTNY